jgi:hypothetical protein
MGGQSSTCNGDVIVYETCEEILTAPITAANASACTPIDIAFVAACDMAFGGPEDPVGDVVCGVATVSVVAACEAGVEAAEDAIAKGISFNPNDLAESVCAEQFCSN